MTSVYAHVSADGSYLYIGRTCQLDKRTKAHKSTSVWWSQVVQVVVLAEAPHDRARHLEAEFIGLHNPRYNWQHTAAWREAAKTGDTARPPAFLALLAQAAS